MPVRFEDELSGRRHQRRHRPRHQASASPGRREPDIQHKRMYHSPEHRVCLTEEPAFQHRRRPATHHSDYVSSEPALQKKKRSKSSSPVSRVEREPALQRKHRPQTSSTKSQIFFLADAAVSTTKPSTTTANTSGLSAPAVHPKPSVSDCTVPASEGATAGPHDNYNRNNSYNEYMLLGDQSKFASNVVYHVRPHTNYPFRRTAHRQKTSSKHTSAATRHDGPMVQSEKQRRESRRRVVDGRNKHSSVNFNQKSTQTSASHGNIVNDDICPTPDAPRDQTKAPRLDIYRPAPRVVVDTGRPGKKMSSQDQQEVPDKSRLQDLSVGQAQPSQSLLKHHYSVPTQNVSGPSPPKDHGQMMSHAWHKRSQTKAEQQVPSAVQSNSNTSILQEHNPSVSQTRFNMSKPKDNQEIKSQAVQLPAKPRDTRSKAVRLEDSITPSPPAKIRPPALQDHGNRPTQYKHIRTKVAENVREKKTKTGVDEVHHRHHEDRRDLSPGQSHEQKENEPIAEHDADHAVKYRLGLVPRRSNEPKRRSEYQQQFQWRPFEHNSPLMSAAQMVYKSCPDLSRLTATAAPVVNSDSEYRAAYRPSSEHHQHNTNNSTDTAAATGAVANDNNDDINEIDQSTSLHDVSGNSDSQPDISSNSRQRSHSAQGRPVHGISVAANWGNFFPTSASCQSEYASNYLEPWKLVPRRTVPAAAAAGDDELHYNDEQSQGVIVDEWYSQVRQLRRDAEDYKRRGQQTHFSREHLAQLSARNAQLWDIVSSHSENLSPHLSPDEFDIAERQQPQPSLHSDSDGDDVDDGSTDDQTRDQTETRLHHHLDHHHHHHHEDDHLPAAEPRHLRDVAVQVDDMTRQSTSSQTVDGGIVRQNQNRKSMTTHGNPTTTKQQWQMPRDVNNNANASGYRDNATSRDTSSVGSSCSLASEVLERARRRQMQLNWT